MAEHAQKPKEKDEPGTTTTTTTKTIPQPGGVESEGGKVAPKSGEPAPKVPTKHGGDDGA